MNTRSVRFRLAAWSALFSAGVLLVVACLLFFQVRGYLRTTIFETQHHRARQIAETLVAQMPELGAANLSAQIEALYAPEKGDRFIRVSGSDGHIYYRSGPPVDQSFDPSAVPLLQSQDQSTSTRIVRFPDGRTLLIANFQAVGNDDAHYNVEVGTSGAPVDQFVRRVLLLLALGSPVVVLVASWGGYLLVTQALRPVEEITGKAAVITQHSLSERLPVSRTGDELERLSIALNHMITRLDDAFGNSRRFVADASHELRTPVTIIQGEIEALIKDSSTPPKFREALSSVLEEVERLAHIVQTLFALSRLDAGEAQAESVRFDLSQLVRNTADQMTLLAEDKGIGLSLDLAVPVYVKGDRSRITQVVVNLLDNAIKYTGRNGKIALRTFDQGNEAVLEVADTGVGIAPEALPRVFDRFFRAGNDQRPEGGAGLGLAIVKSICSAHAGRVEVESTLGKGSRFRVVLPAAPA